MSELLRHYVIEEDWLYAENDSPHPHVLVALGLINLKAPLTMSF